MVRLIVAGLVVTFWTGCWAADEDAAAKCPRSATALQASCKEITRKDLPKGAVELLRRMKCDVAAGSNYDYGSAVDLNGDGSPEHQVCCNESMHGPCGAVVIGKIDGVWKDLTANNRILGFDGACGDFVILESQHGGYHDVCLPIECAPGTGTPEKPCTPTLWQYDKGRYRISEREGSDARAARR